MYAPFDEKSLWTGIFRKYHEYKTCLEEAAKAIDAITEVADTAIKVSQDTIDMGGQQLVHSTVEAEKIKQKEVKRIAELEKLAAGCEGTRKRNLISN